MDYRILLGISAMVLNVVGYVPYIRDILKGKVKPHKVTWGIWSILTTIAAFNQVKNGGGYSSLFFISAAVLVTITFILSLKYGIGGASKIDRLCLILAILLLAYWIGVRDYRISTVLAIAIDAVAFVPTLIKTYKHPETETYIQWVCAGLAGLLTLFAVARKDWALMIFPAYVFVFNFGLVGLKFLADKKSAAKS